MKTCHYLQQLKFRPPAVGAAVRELLLYRRSTSMGMVRKVGLVWMTTDSIKLLVKIQNANKSLKMKKTSKKVERYTNISNKLFDQKSQTQTV